MHQKRLVSHKLLRSAVLSAGVGAALTVAAWTGTALAQVSPTAFTYQGRLQEGGSGVDAVSARLQFRLWNQETGGQQIGSSCIVYPVEITEGFFAAPVDFGAEAFDGQVRWLEIGVDPSGGTSYTWMAPRQPLTAAPMALFAMHGGDNPWTINGNNITYNTGNVGIGVTAPGSRLEVQMPFDNNITPMAILRTTGENSTSSIRFQNGSGNHYNLGITAGNELALGYNANVPLPGDLLRITSAGNLGIGTINPTAKLDVNGSLRATGFRLGSSATAGYVLTADASGNGTWQPAAGGGGYWSGGSGGVIYYNGGYVGIGSSSPTHPLLVYSASGEGAIKGRIDGSSGIAVEGRASSTTGDVTGVYGSAVSTDGKGVFGQHINTDGYGSGVKGTSSSPNGYAVFAENVATSGSAVGLFGKSNSATGFGGYFIGKGYFSGNVGVGTTSPASALEVEGTVTMDGLRLGTAATPGHVLTADASGNGTWQPAPADLWQSSGSNIYYNGGSVGVGTGTPGAMTHVVNTGIGKTFRADDEAGDTTPFIIMSDGKVGIGHSDPPARLTVATDEWITHAAHFEDSGPAETWNCVLAESRYTYDMEAALGRRYEAPQTGVLRGYGVYASSSISGADDNYGIYAYAGSGGTNYAGYFSGNVTVTGTLSKGGGTFTIDHPLDPENRILQHSFVESPDMMNVYNGNIVLDDRGEAVVTLPDWFESLNRDFRYQLTCLGGFAPVYVAEKVRDNRFRIAGGTAGLEVSWQVTGVRQDAFANANRVQVELEKRPEERGLFLHPEARGLSREMGIDYARHASGRVR